MKIKRALISVSDKTGVVEFARVLQKAGVEIVSTGGTMKALREAGIPVVYVSDVTGFPEIMDGRVKTLHPFVHGGILAVRGNQTHEKALHELKITPIDLVAVNLYPFKETVANPNVTLAEAVEQIDIGGPAMVRSAAKNFASVYVVTSPLDYDAVLQNLNSADESEKLKFRQNLMIKAYEHTAAYDAMIANYMNERFNGGFGAKKFITGSKVFDTRYGENPHQKGALYEFEDFFSNHFKSLKGEASFNNMTDMHGALMLASSFGEAPAVAICKHANPCGFAVKGSLLESYGRRCLFPFFFRWF